MGVSLSVSIQRRTEELEVSGYSQPTNPDFDRNASLMDVGNAKSIGDARILDGARDTTFENCKFTAVGGDMVKNVYNVNLVVPDNVYERIVVWISAINYQDIQDDNLSKQIGETSMWVLDEPVFIDWAGRNGGILWGTGIPGAGKTVMASILIDHLRKRAKNDKMILVAFAFCRYTDSLRIKTILAAIVRQLLEDYPSTTAFVVPLYEKHRLRKTSPTEAELVEVLSAIFTSDMFDKRFLFVDGLDEATSETQFDILDTLSNLPLNVLFTSRPLPLLKDVVPEARFFDIIVRDADIKRLIDEKVRSMKMLAKLLEQDGMREMLFQEVLTKSSGMFLVASLQLDMLGSCLNIRDLRAGLEQLPKGVEAMYASTMERIEHQADPSLAKLALVWLVHALESMTIDDLRHALAFDPVRSKYDPELLVDADSLVSVCCGLITLEPQSKLVRLVHYTAKDFLKPYLRKDYPEPHSLISSSCVARMIYCGLHDMQDGIWSLYSSIPFYGNPFLGYSHSRWALHSHLCASIPPATVDLILQCRNFPIFHREDLLLDSGSSAHVAAAYGFPSLLREWFDQSHSGSLALPHNLDVNARTRDGFTPLWLASHFGHIEVVNILLDAEGIDVCCPNNHKVTPLMTASGNGHLKIVQLFLGVVDIEHVNATNKTSCSALIYASHSGRMEVVRAILGFQSTRNRCNTTLDNTVRVNDGISYGSGININGASNIGWTALIHAARQDHPGVVKELLRVKDISVNPHNSGMGRTLLYWALNKGYMDIAELLRSRGAQ